MDIIEISGQESWKHALARVPRHDCYHSWDFHQISRQNGEGNPVMFEVRLSNGGILFPLLSRTIEGSSFKDLTSVYGYPSPLFYGEIEEVEIPSFWDALISHLYQQGYVSLFSRSHPILTSRLLGEEHLQPSGRVVIIRLDRPEQEQYDAYRPDHKASLRKLHKLGARCVQDNGEGSLKGLIDNYEATMRSLEAASYYFFPAAYYRALLDAGDFEVRIYSCTLDDAIMCSGIFVFSGEFVQFHLSGTAAEFRNLAPTKLMLDTVRRDAARLGYKYFCLGGGHGAREDSLFNFKSGFSRFTRDFHLIRKIINHEEYQKLSEHSPVDTSFFPRYRAPKA